MNIIVPKETLDADLTERLRKGGLVTVLRKGEYHLVTLENAPVELPEPKPTRETQDLSP